MLTTTQKEASWLLDSVLTFAARRLPRFGASVGAVKP